MNINYFLHKWQQKKNDFPSFHLCIKKVKQNKQNELFEDKVFL